jgi:hypothetical protein
VSDGANGRTHEPSQRELVVQHDALERLVDKNDAAIRDVLAERDRVLTERDRRYEDRFKALEVNIGDRFKAAETAVGAALAANKELTNASFVASEKAIGKAETAQADYNVRSNEFRGQLDDQAKTLMPRAEAQVQFKAYDEKIDQLRTEIASLRESRSETGGQKHQQLEARQQGQWAISVGVAFAGVIIAAAVLASKLIH